MVTARGEYAGPVRGGRASINGAEFWICPECSCCVMEALSDDWHRRLHTEWHDANRKAPSLKELQRIADEHTRLWADEIRGDEDVS